VRIIEIDIEPDFLFSGMLQAAKGFELVLKELKGQMLQVCATEVIPNPVD
jgi:hypothetical protein